MNEIPENIHDIIMEDIELFSKRHKVSIRSVGRNGIGDNNLYGRLEEGKNLTLRKAAELYQYMNERDKILEERLK